MFDFSDGVATSVEAGFPPGVESTFKMEEECDSTSDYDAPAQDLVEGDTFETKQSTDSAAPLLPGRTVGAYVVKYTPYRTFVSESGILRRPLMDEV